MVFFGTAVQSQHYRRHVTEYRRAHQRYQHNTAHQLLVALDTITVLAYLLLTYTHVHKYEQIVIIIELYSATTLEALAKMLGKL